MLTTVKTTRTQNKLGEKGPGHCLPQCPYTISVLKKLPHLLLVCGILLQIYHLYSLYPERKRVLEPRLVESKRPSRLVVPKCVHPSKSPREPAKITDSGVVLQVLTQNLHGESPGK